MARSNENSKSEAQVVEGDAALNPGTPRDGAGPRQRT